MGGESKTTQSQTSQTTPYGPAQQSLDLLLNKLGSKAGSADLTGAETGALNTLQANANNGNPFTGDITSLANGLLSGGGAQANDAAIKGLLGNVTGQLTPFANGSMVGNNTALQSQLDTISNDVQNRVNSMFAGAGRDLSGMNQQTLARGIAEGTAPVIAAQYNQDVGNQMNAAKSLFDAGNTTYGLLNGNQQQANANATTGIDVGNQALSAENYGPMQTLAIEAQRRGIPIDTLNTLLGTVSPVAQAFGTTNATGTATQQSNPMQTLVGGLLGGGALLSRFGR
jgi:hypothetical protein